MHTGTTSAWRLRAIPNMEDGYTALSYLFCFSPTSHLFLTSSVLSHHLPSPSPITISHHHLPSSSPIIISHLCCSIYLLIFQFLFASIYWYLTEESQENEEVVSFTRLLTSTLSASCVTKTLSKLAFEVLDGDGIGSVWHADIHFHIISTLP
jgi:hypothetical protein